MPEAFVYRRGEMPRVPTGQSAEAEGGSRATGSGERFRALCAEGSAVTEGAVAVVPADLVHEALIEGGKELATESVVDGALTPSVGVLQPGVTHWPTFACAHAGGIVHLMAKGVSFCDVLICSPHVVSRLPATTSRASAAAP
jgi:hypothetical protein